MKHATVIEARRCALRSWLTDRQAAWMLMLALCSSACNDSGNREQHATTIARLEPLHLQAIHGQAGELEVVRLQRIYPAQQTPWLVRGATASYEANANNAEDKQQPAAEHLQLRNVNGALLRIPGPFEQGSFNRVVLQVVTQRSATFVIEFISRGRTLPLRVRTVSGSQGGLQALTFACPELAQQGVPINKIQLTLEGRSGPVRIDSLDLLWQPPESFLPLASSGAELIQLGGEARRGVGLVPGTPLEGRIASSDDGELSFSYHIPAFFAQRIDQPVLLVSLLPEGGEAVVRRVPLDLQATLAWSSLRLKLDEFGGAPLRVRWSLENAGGIACAIAEPALVHPTEEPRHVVLITSDTHRADYLGAAKSGVEVQTPALDALAQRGLFFTDAFSSANVTNPSHIAMMTGRHPRDIGIFVNNERLAQVAPTLAEAFKAAGYATYAAISVRHLGPSMSGLGQGFDRLSTPLQQSTRDGTFAIDDALRWLAESPDVPAFLWLHLYDAHAPYEPPREFRAMYYPADRDPFDPSLPALEGLPASVTERHYPGLKDLAYPEAMYRAEVSFLDHGLQKLLENNAMHAALIAFTADHGESLGEHSTFYNHEGLYTQLIHVPLILVWPGAPAGKRVSTPVEHIDLGRTLLDLAGLAHVDFPGRNLTLLEGLAPSQPRFALGAHAQTASITRDRWHLILHLAVQYSADRLKPTVKHQVELFHLESDPTCATDLLETQLPKARELRAELLHWLADAHDLGWRGGRKSDATTIAQLEALGYAGGTEAEPQSVRLFDPDCECERCARFK